MVFVKKFLTPQQMKEAQTTKTWKAKSRMVICGNFAIETEAVRNPSALGSKVIVKVVLPLEAIGVVGFAVNVKSPALAPVMLT